MLLLLRLVARCRRASSARYRCLITKLRCRLSRALVRRAPVVRPACRLGRWYITSLRTLDDAHAAVGGFAASSVDVGLYGWGFRLAAHLGNLVHVVVRAARASVDAAPKAFVDRTPGKDSTTCEKPNGGCTVDLERTGSSGDPLRACCGSFEQC